ncbi:hypothetical protein RchiOBHm_Chr2g0086611 [Rosa chinensis]|uniref:Uncharacterized protein n=1 Tax=Rosa chinensis TaxID=74649 RepID=A0A2P6RIE6_ROSCH|nr:hypothetical protein RchiOBHm_Chr2g0086611 [Rosa chinensis]
MATLGISGMMFHCVFEGSLSMQDTEIERRPYHKNCNCALHRSMGDACSNACPQQRNISFPKKQSWADSFLCIATASKFSSQHSFLANTSTFTGNRESVNGAQCLSHRQ